MRLLSSPFFVFLLLAAGTVRTGEQHPWNDKRVYYVVAQGGKLREKGYFVRRIGSWRKAPCVVIEEDRFYFLEGESLTPARSVKVRSITTLDGLAIQRHEETIIGGSGRETIVVEDGEAHFDNSNPSYGEPFVLPAPAGLVFDVNGEWLAAQSPRIGAEYEARVLERRARKVRIETVSIRERLSSGGDPSVWIAEFNSPGRTPMFARFTSDGRLIRLESGSLIYQVVGRDDFELGRVPRESSLPPLPGETVAAAPELAPPVPALTPIHQASPVPAESDGGVPAGLSIPAWDGFAWMALRANPSGLWNGAFPDSAYSRLEYDASGVVVVSFRNAPRAGADAVLPMTASPDVAAFLSATPQLPAADPAIIGAARLATLDEGTQREERNALRAVSFLAGWINQNISPLPWNGGASPPARTLADRAGDALSAARLFAAMVRTLGAPSLVCQGLLVRSGRAIPHAWSEVWIDDVWIPVDVAVNRVGLPAGYILAERSRPDGDFYGDFPSILRSPGAELILLSAGRETPDGEIVRLVAGEHRTYAWARGEWLANLYWGFALRLPPGWIGSARMDSVEASDPESLAWIKCEALPGDFVADRTALEDMISGLRRNLGRFRLVDSRVTAFDADGAMPALFADFSSRAEGANLRCRQYFLPRRQRAFRISFWAPINRFDEFAPAFDRMLASWEF
jgi:hypothetical protein